MIDLSYIDSADFLTSIGIKNISVSSGEITFSCPSEDHLHGDSRPSARMNVKTTAFTCHGCGWRGNAIIFLSKYKSIPETVARRLLEERYGFGLSAPIGNLSDEVEKIMSQEKINIKEERVTPSEEWIDNFYVDWDEDGSSIVDYIIGRGFYSTTLIDWQIGYDQYSGRITIPIRDHLGKLVGFKGRTWRKDETIKYLIIGDTKLGHPKYRFQTYKKSEFVFGLDKIICYKGISFKSRMVPKKFVIVEGELNVIMMNQYGYDNVVSIAGSEFSETQRDLIKKYCDEAIIFFDDDEAGRRGTRKVVEMLSPYMSLSVVQNAPGDAAELSKEQIDDLISGAEPALLLQAKGEL